jgi:hypothetical protein
MWKIILAVPLLLLAVPCGGAGAQAPTSLSPSADAPPPQSFGQSIMTPRGPIVTTGRAGAFTTTTLPRGQGGQGLLLDNGNGTSTLVGPRGRAETVATPR